jgi:hypothetical protein
LPPEAYTRLKSNRNKDVYAGRRGFSVWPFAYRTRVEFAVMCQVKPKNRFMRIPSEDLGLIWFTLSIEGAVRFVKLEIPMDREAL